MLQFHPLIGDVPSFGDCIAPLADRVARFQKWAAEVRDPAEKVAQTEKLEVPGARAEYAVAQLLKSWAVKISCAYTTGSMYGMGSPWEEKPSREACVDAFLEAARLHFGHELHPGVSDRQKAARTQMLALLHQEGDQLQLFR